MGSPSVFYFLSVMYNVLMLTFSIFALITIFLLNIIVGMYYGFGFRHYCFFESLHFLGGFFVATLLSSFTNSLILIFIGLSIITILWELAEYLISKSRIITKFMKRNLHVSLTSIDWKDTLLDIILNFSGAIVFIVSKIVFLFTTTILFTNS